MKTTQNFLIALILFNSNLFAQIPGEIKEEYKGSFVEFNMYNNSNDSNNWNDLFNEKEEIKDKTIPIMISSDFINKVLENKQEYINVTIPFYDNNEIDLKLIKRDFDFSTFQLVVRTENGDIQRQYNPGFIAYEIEH
jgi:hypothetical protein